MAISHQPVPAPASPSPSSSQALLGPAPPPPASAPALAPAPTPTPAPAPAPAFASAATNSAAGVTATATAPGLRRHAPDANGGAGAAGRLNDRRARPCRYFGTAGGCRAGENCPFSHDPSRVPSSISSPNQGLQSGTSTAPKGGQVTRSRQAVTQAVPARIVSKPIPKAQAEDPREFQLGQLRKRYSPKEKKHLGSGGTEDGSVLNFSVVPSDPDFPFEMASLQCSLVVPASYPGPESAAKPRLMIQNKDIPRGFAINIEHGFDGLVEEKKNATLLALISALDKNLEAFLSEKKAETVKLVVNADKRHLANLPVRAVGTVKSSSSPKDISPSLSVAVHSKPVEVFTAAQIADAAQRRQLETRQLDARLGRLPLYKKSSDGIAYTLAIEPRKRAELPLYLRTIKTLQLFVPLLYPLHCCRIHFEGLKLEDVKGTEMAFEEHAKEKKDMSLMGHMNFLAQNLHILTKTSPISEAKVDTHILRAEDEPAKTLAVVESVPGTLDTADDRGHIKIIPRPPEWAMMDSSDVSDTDDDYSYDSEAESDDGDAKEGDVKKEISSMPLKNPEKGTAISFPFIELYGIELLEVTALNLTVRCERCKDTTDILGLKNDAPKTESCKKCAVVLKVGFRPDLIHANAVRAGFLDLEGCTVVDMLPSTFTPTCSNCSTAYPPPGIISVRGETTTNVCRECHQKFTLKIPSVKFLRITTSALPPSTGPRRMRETLGLVNGTALPDRGRCKHYSKSYRWFRFSCCDKVYPCDRCHDVKEEHPNEHANRMICGWCSREQNYRPEDCAFCGNGVVGRKGSGFWEGGKGTRDKVRMSRKDPRKHRRIGGGAKAKD